MSPPLGTSPMSVNALHSAARRYCMERLDALAAVHQYLAGERGPEQQSAWLAALALRGILPDVERISPRDVPSTTALRTLLVDRCSYAQWPAGDARHQADEQWEPAAAERARFRSYITSLTDDDAEHLPRVPSRRTLDAKQRRGLLRRVARAWPAGGEQWHPISAVLASSHVLALQSAWVGTEDLPLGPMRRVLAALAAGRRIWELHEGAPRWTDDVREYTRLKGVERIGRAFPPGFERDPALWWTPTVGTETLWASSRLDWLLYAHHEAALYVAGRELVARTKEAWPNWHRHVWTTHAYSGPTHPSFSRHLA
ncbi:MAG: hypothetical protein M3069_26075 [Chloroflexota bacterium]|nr:hypothetical protein [Chloroflexota bacterium]